MVLKRQLTAAPLVFVANMNGTLVHYNEAVERGFVPGAVVSG